MNCSFDQHLLQDYLENTIEPLEKLILIEHLKVCKICRHELTELKLLYWEFNNLSNVDIPFEAENIKESVLADIHTSDTYNKNKPYYSLKDYISIQTSIAENASTFFRFIPGTKKVSSLLDTISNSFFKNEINSFTRSPL